jgi:hypothetical protein
LLLPLATCLLFYTLAGIKEITGVNREKSKGVCESRRFCESWEPEIQASKIISEVMPPVRSFRPPPWYTIPIRVLLVSFIGTLLSFAVSLLLAIFGTVLVSVIRGAHPDMRLAYRHIALPAALIAGCVIVVVASVMEIRHYRQSKTLSAIERMS